MRASGLNHVSIPAVDVEESLRFYVEVFGMEELPAPRFGYGSAVRWLRLGDLQVHLFPVEERPARTAQHFGFEVDDFEAAYRRLKELGIFASAGDRAAAVWELPGGEVQMYFRDPSDNLVEIDWPDVGTLDRSLFGDELKKLADEIPQSEENLRARLFLRETARI
jgi:catechol 2,3-dioxygenase-like lactoylglutathione lyase family enzyme